MDERRAPGHHAEVTIPEAPEPTLLRSGAARGLLLATGFVFVGLAAVGAVLPVLPTTPFLLVAAACFARSSPRFYRWLLENRVFGPLIRHWRDTRSIPRRAKLAAIVLIAAVGGTSVVFFLTHVWARAAVSAVLLALIVWLARVPSSEARRPPLAADSAAVEGQLGEG